MNIFSIPNIITGLILLIIGFNVKKNNNTIFTTSFYYLCLSSALWQLLYGISYLINSYKVCQILLRLGFSSVTFIGINYLIFTLKFLNIQFKKLENLLFIYGIFVALLINFTNLIISDIKLYYWGYYPIKGPFYLIFLFIFILMLNTALTLLIYKFIKAKFNLSYIRKQQIKYVLLALLIYSFASIDFLPNLGLSIYPIGYIPTLLFISIISYCAFRYNLLNLRIVIARTSIFLTLYIIVLLIPYTIVTIFRSKLLVKFGDEWFLIPILLSTLLAMIAPFLYFKLIRKTGDKILIKQKQLQNQIIKFLNNTKNLYSLKHLIMYIENELKSILNVNFVEYVDYNNLSNPIKLLLKDNQIINIDEIKQKSLDFNDQNMNKIYKKLLNDNLYIVIPIIINKNQILGCILIGQPIDHKNNFLHILPKEIFTILQTQLSLAFENAMFYEEVKKTHQQLLKAEKMATIGIMADGLSHQINNRLHALSFIASDVLDTLKLKNNLFQENELSKLKQELEQSLHRIEKNIAQCGEIVRGLLKYSRSRSNHKFDKINLNEVLESTLEMAKFKIKPGSVDIINRLPNNLPDVAGHFSELQEVFFNIIDNAYDAMMQKQYETPESDYKPTLIIEPGEITNDEVEIKFIDNGIGIKEEDKEKLFTPFFSTKLSSQKGTGLGLFVIQKIIEDHHDGKVNYESRFKDGTVVSIRLKRYTGPFGSFEQKTSDTGHDIKMAS